MKSYNYKPEPRLSLGSIVLGIFLFMVFLLITGTMDYRASKQDYCERKGQEYDLMKDQCFKPCERNVK